MSAYMVIIIVLTTSVLRCGSISICVKKEDRGIDNCVSSLQDAIKNGLDSPSSNLVIEVQSSIELSDVIYIEDFSGYFELKANGTFTILCTPTTTRETNAGIVFRSVKNITIHNLVFDGCGSLQNSTTKDMNPNNIGTVLFKSGLYFQNCSNVGLTNVVVRNGDGTGVSFFDTTGNITVLNSVFENNRPKSPHPGGGGVYVEFTYCAPGRFNDCDSIHTDPDHTMYLFHNCSFVRNNASTYYPEKIGYIHACRSEFQGLGKGGGLSIWFRGDTQHKRVNVSNCTFMNNSAIVGGALKVEFQDYARTNYVSIEKCKFVSNRCRYEGGAALLGYTFLCDDDTAVNVSQSQPNNITLKYSLFERNSAKYGGGVYLFSTRGTHVAHSRIKFSNCTWTGNKALSGSAVDIIPEVWERLGNGALPIPLFINSTFEMNKVITKSTQLGENVSSSVNGVGAILITGFKVKFAGETRVSNNDGTALYLISSTVQFMSKSVSRFYNNTGRLGGAVALITFSVMFINDNATLEFIGNSAISKGGAIYKMSIEKHDTSRSCFMQYIGKKGLSQRNVHFHFEENIALTGDGNIIHATSLLPCFYSCLQSEHNKTFEYFSTQHIFSCIGNITGQVDDDTVCCNVTTEPRNFTLLPNSSFSEIFPGKEAHIPLVALDEFSHNQTVVYQATMESQTRNISVDPSYQLISNGIIKFQGESGAKGTLLLDHNDASVFFNVTLDECPPGFILETSTWTCICAAFRFDGIWKCGQSNAFVTRGFWVGLYHNEIYTALCPAGFCSYVDKVSYQTELPSRVTDLDHYICGSNRTGILCGECRGERSTYYHSYSYRCADNKLCHIGWLLYLLSELVPLTIVFIIVMLFNISFTSGAVNGFVLFAQVLDSFTVDAGGYIQFPPVVCILTPVHRFLYRMFNFDFFSNERLSFCLWRDASALDAMVMKYVTIIYAFGLVMLTVFFMNTWKCKVLLSHWRPRSLRNAVIHGLSTFFVICYSQSARVSFQILNPGFLYSEGKVIVVFRSGNLTWGQGKHLLYAIPALFFLFFMVLIPPVLLILFPLVFKVLALCKLSETKVAIFISRLIPMQLLDSFQGCFKDEFRFFSGFYFLYRLLALAAYAFTGTFDQFYIVVEIGIVVIIGLHSIVQPYKKRLHNIIDSLIFVNLAVINGLSLINYIKTTEGIDNDTRKVAFTSAVQLILIFLPLIFIVFYLLLRNNVSKFTCCKKSNEEKVGFENSCDLPALRDDFNVGTEGDYKAFTNNDYY